MIDSLVAFAVVALAIGMTLMGVSRVLAVRYWRPEVKRNSFVGEVDPFQQGTFLYRNLDRYIRPEGTKRVAVTGNLGATFSFVGFMLILVRLLTAP